MQSLTPVQSAERIHLIDALRGIAILGIFIANLPVGFSFYDAFLVFIGQIIFSTIWLKYFNYGPVEWLWRSGTYGKWQKQVRR